MNHPTLQGGATHRIFVKNQLIVGDEVTRLKFTGNCGVTAKLEPRYLVSYNELHGPVTMSP